MNLVSAGLLLFWGVYFSMAGIGNVVDYLTQHGYKGKYFRFSSKNYELLEKVAKKHNSGKGPITTLFVVIMCMELASAVLYLASFVLYLGGQSILTRYAFFAGMSLFAGLVLGNEAFIYYDDEEEHVVMLIAQLVSYIAVVVL